MSFFDRFRKNKADAAAPSPDSSISGVDERSAYAKYMTGQLIALYKQTHRQEYQTEYMRRLQKIGFSVEEATRLFFLELMIIKHFSIQNLAAEDYLNSTYFDLQNVRFPESTE